jgi:hypothetical protein
MNTQARHVPVGRSEAWNALSASSFFSLAVSTFFSCPSDPFVELIVVVHKNIFSSSALVPCESCELEVDQER